MQKLQTLTDNQKKNLSKYRDKWLRIGLSTEPIDLGLSKSAINETYRCAGLRPPSIYIWLKSPLEGAIGTTILNQVWAQVRDQVGAQVGAQVRAQVGAQVGAQVRDQVGAQVRDQVWDQVRDQVWDQVRAQVGDQVGAQVGDQVRDQVGAQVRDQVRAQVWAQVWDQVRAQVGDQVRAPVWAQVRAQVGAQVWAQVRDQVWAQVWAQVGDQVRAQVWAQVRDQVGAQVWDQVKDQVGAQVGDQVRDQVRAQVGDQVWDQVRDQVGAQVRDQVWDQVRDQVWAQVRAQVGDQVRAQVWAQVRDQVWDQVRDQVRAQVWDQVRDQVRDQVWDQVWNQVGDQVNRAIYGAHDASWLSFYEYMQQVCHVQNIDRLSGLYALANTTGWCWCFDHCVIITERPVLLLRDTENRLHCETGPAIQYSDSWGIWALHGVRVPQYIIEQPELITLDKVLKENNQEIRRVMLERFGWNRVLKELEAKNIHNDQYGNLYETDKLSEYLEGEDTLAKFVSVVDPSTKRQYMLRVPPDVATAKDAVGWTFGVEKNQYKPTQEA